MHFTYVLLSQQDKRMYIGSTKDLRTNTNALNMVTNG